jgi:hypothetical protein
MEKPAQKIWRGERNKNPEVSEVRLSTGPVMRRINEYLIRDSWIHHRKLISEGFKLRFSDKAFLRDNNLHQWSTEKHHWRSEYLLA